MRHHVEFDLVLPKRCEVGNAIIKDQLRYLIKRDLGDMLTGDDMRVYVRNLKIKKQK